MLSQASRVLLGSFEGTPASAAVPSKQDQGFSTVWDTFRVAWIRTMLLQSRRYSNTSPQATSASFSVLNLSTTLRIFLAHLLQLAKQWHALCCDGEVWKVVYTVLLELHASPDLLLAGAAMLRRLWQQSLLNGIDVATRSPLNAGLVVTDILAHSSGSGWLAEL